MQYKYKTLQEQGKENNNKTLHLLCQVVWRAREKEEEKEV